VTTTEPAQTRRTLNQIVDPSGTAHTATATSNIWVGTRGVFSTPSEGNKIEAFISGKDYFASLIAACEAATQEICILGWQVNWDAQLAPGRRLWGLLYDAAKRGVKAYVMPWDDTNPMQTYDDQTKLVLEDINRRLGLEGSAKRVFVTTSSSWSAKNASYFSHHQKMVVVDRTIAFVGGIDIAYGRYCDDSFTLKADADGRQVMNRYNGGVPWVGKLSESDPKLVNPDLMSGAGDAYAWNPLSKDKRTNLEEQSDRVAAGGWQVPYAEPGGWNTVNNAVGTGRRMEWNGTDYAVARHSQPHRRPGGI
jgi:phospholipase D1/2